MKAAKLSVKAQKRQNRRATIKAVLAIIMALFLVGLAVMPAFTEVTPPSASTPETQRETGYTLMDFMIDAVTKGYFKDVSRDALIEGAYKGIFQALDPHSTYFSPKEYKQFAASLEGSFGGIGASIAQGKNGYVEVVSPLKGTPAERAGLLPGDEIVAIDGVDAKDYAVEEAVSVIRGEPGTKVKLDIRRAGAEKPFRVVIVREMITIESLSFKILDDGTGYIALHEFAAGTAADFDAAMTVMKAKGVKRLVLDLRGNPGGYLDTAIHVADYFVPRGKVIVKLDYKGTDDRTHRAAHDPVDMAVVVLVDGGSASASEIVAGALQQTGTALVVGETTYGKGTVQNLMPLINGGGMKLTIAEYVLAGDYHVDGKGVVPDIEAKAPRPLTADVLEGFAPIRTGDGATSLNVYAVQQRLSALGFSLKADGLYGAATKEAVRRFQSIKGLDAGMDANACLDEKTLKAFDALTARDALGADLALEKALDVLKNGR